MLARIAAPDANGNATYWQHVRERASNVVHITRERRGTLNRRALCGTTQRGGWQPVDEVSGSAKLCRTCQALWGRGEAA